MAWIKIDDGFFRHPKAIRAGRDGRILFIASVCYAGSNLTDGYVPEGALAFLAAETGISKPRAAAACLVECGLWERCDGGYMVHDYLDYNTASGKVHAERDAARERMRAKRSQDVRPNISRSSPEVRQPETEVETEGSIEPNGSQELEGGAPTPIDPEPEKQKRRIRLPDLWEPTAKQREALGADGYSTTEIDGELVKFRNYYHHKGETGLRWDLSFSNWMAKSREMNRRPALTTVNGMPPEIARLPWNNATRMKWENDHRAAS